VFIKINKNHIWPYAQILAAYESLPAQYVDEASTNDVSASLPSFLRLAQKTGKNPYFYELLQSQKSLNTLNYCCINAIE